MGSAGFDLLDMPPGFMPTFQGRIPPDTAAWNVEITRLAGLFMSSNVEQKLKPLLVREIATCVFLRSGGECRDDIDSSAAFFKATVERGHLVSTGWTSRHLYHFCVILRISFESIREGEYSSNSVEFRRLEDADPERDSPLPVQTARSLATLLIRVHFITPSHTVNYFDEAISLLRTAYTSTVTCAIRRETRLDALKELVAALILRFRASSCAQDITDAVEYSYIMFDVAPDSTDPKHPLYLSLDELNPFPNTADLDLCETICHSMSQRRRIHAIPHRAILRLWCAVLGRKFTLTGRCEGLDAFQLSVHETLIADEEFPESDKAELLLYTGILLFMTCGGGSDGRGRQIHEAESYLHSARSCPGCPPNVRSLATHALCGLHATRYSYSYHPSDIQRVTDILTADFARQIELGKPQSGLAGLLDTLVRLTEHYANIAQAVTGTASPEMTLYWLDAVILLIPALEALCASNPEQRAKYLNCAAVCHLERFRVKKLLLGAKAIFSEAAHQRMLSTSPEEVEEDYASVISFARELIMLEATTDGGEIFQGIHSSTGVGHFCEAVILKYKDLGLVWKLKLEEIDEAIALVSSCQDFHGVSINRSIRLKQFVSLLAARNRFSHKYNPATIEDIIRHATLLLHDPFMDMYPRQRMELAIQRAMLMNKMAHPTVSQAFRESLELSEDVISLAPTLEAQFESLQELSTYFGLAAIHAVNQGEIRAVVELLEQGRGLLWTQMRRLRASVDPLVDSTDVRLKALGEDFQITSLELETLVISVMPEEDSTLPSLSSVGPVSARLAEKDRLRARLAYIVGEIRTCPGFEDFLRLASFDDLKQAAKEGPVVMVYCNNHRSFVLILFSHRDPVYIDLNHTTFVQLCALSSERLPSVANMCMARLQTGPASRAYDTALQDVLEATAKLIVGPVVEKLERFGLKPGTGKRVWWCPVGIACMIPLHAAGPFTQHHEGKWLPDLYVSSYTPSLSALIEARANARTSTPSLDATSRAMLIVGQPSDPSLENVSEEIHTVLSILPLEVTPTFLLDGDASLTAVCNAMGDHSWLHMACHGISNDTVPTKSAFQLGGNDRLTLRDIIKLRLPRAEFAFLSACSTAETNFQPAGITLRDRFDEVFHLSAAMQFCGFRGVVGTMWTVNDEDGLDVARHFYRELSREGGETMQVEDWDPRKAAHALNKAVRKLKKKLGGRQGSLERWVNFIHIGI